MFECAAAYAAKAQRALINDPARPLQTLALNNLKAAPLQDRFDFPELNSLASTGLAIQEVGASINQPMILREQTTYQLNLYGQSDDAYELVTTLATLAKLLRNQKQAITSKFPRSKLADDGTKFGPGQAIVTPGIIKSELISEYQMDMWNGLVENISAFKRNLMVERDPNDPNRVNVLYPPDLINQLRIFAVLAQFRLQYDRGIDLEIIGAATGPFNAAGQTPAVTQPRLGLFRHRRPAAIAWLVADCRHCPASDQCCDAAMVGCTMSARKCSKLLSQRSQTLIPRPP